MKVLIENFGPISVCELDLAKNLILITGSNNLGKSYATNLVYALLKGFLRSKDLSLSHWTGQAFQDRNELENWLTRMIGQYFASDSPMDAIDITADFGLHVRKFMSKAVLPDIRHSLSETFGDILHLPNRLSNQPLKITLYNSIFRIDFGIVNGHLEILNIKFWSNRYYLSRSETQKEPEWLKYKTIFHLSANRTEFLDAYFAAIFGVFLKLTSAVKQNIADLHYIPASRSGLYQALGTFGKMIAQLSKRRSFLAQKFELPGVAQPLSDYIGKLSDIQIQVLAENTYAFFEIAERIENEILHGKIGFEEESKHLIFHPDGTDLALDLSYASSLVSEISPIVAYLKYVLPHYSNRTQILIIEEPEAHLHPETQTRLMAILNELVTRTKVKIIITSHSADIFKKCSDLMIEKEIARNAFSAILFSRSLEGGVANELEITVLGIGAQRMERTRISD